jgi:hypothetical protein
MQLSSFAACCALAMSGAVVGQVTIQDAQPGIPAVNPVSSSSPQIHLVALEDMTASSNGTLDKSLSREKRMRTFIESNGLGQAFDAFKGSDTHDMAMSFGEALHQAIVNVQMHQPTQQGGEGDVSREISAYEKLARSSWDRLQASMTAVQRMSDFLQGQGKLNDYMKWAGDQATAAHKALLERGESAAKVARAHEAQLQVLIANREVAFKKAMAKNRRDRLKWNWDVYKFNAKHGLTRTQLNEINNPYSGFRNYSDDYNDSGGFGLSSTGHFQLRGSDFTP